MSNLKNITGTVSSKKKAGVNVTLADGRRGFLPTAAFGDANPKKCDRLTVDIVSEEKGLLQLALSTKEENMESKIVTRFEERMGALVAAASASFTPAPIITDEVELVLPARSVPEITFPEHGLDLDKMPGTGWSEVVRHREFLKRFIVREIPADVARHSQAADEMSPLLLAGIEDAKTCFLDFTNSPDLFDRRPPVRIPPLFDETEHSCGSLDEVMDRAASDAKGTAPVLFTEQEKSLGDGQSGSREGTWAQLRSMAASEKNFQLMFKRVNGQPGLVAMYRGIRCFLPKGEMSRNLDINSVPAEGSQQWVKIISISKPKRSILVSMRIGLPRAELLKVSESKTAEGQNRKEVRAKAAKSAAATKAAAAINAEKDYEWLSDGQEVHGEVVKILKKTGKGDKPFVMYFVRVGTQLAGVLREVHVPFEQGTRRPRVFKVGERVKVRVIRKYRGQDKTGADVPKVDLSMRPPESSKQSRKQHGKPRVRTFGETKDAPPAAPSQVLNEGKGKGKRRKGKGNGKGGHQNSKSTAGGTAIGDALIAAFAAARSSTLGL